MYREWLKLMVHLGKCVSLGLSELTTKAALLENNRTLLSSPDLNLISQSSPQYHNLMDFIRFELELGIGELNSVNFSKIWQKTIKN